MVVCDTYSWQIEQQNLSRCRYCATFIMQGRKGFIIPIILWLPENEKVSTVAG